MIRVMMMLLLLLLLLMMMMMMMIISELQYLKGIRCHLLESISTHEAYALRRFINSNFIIFSSPEPKAHR